MIEADTVAIAEYIHSVHATMGGQGSPPGRNPTNGRMRKLIMTATRNGYFFVLDRTTGEHLVTSKLGLTNVWAQGLDEKGQPKRNPFKDAAIAGSLVNGSVLNYPPAKTSAPGMPPRGRDSGIRRSAACRVRPKPSCSTANSTCCSAVAVRSSCSS